MYGKFWSTKLKGKDKLEDLCVDGNNIKIDFKEIGYEVVEWIHVAHNRNK